MWYPHQGIGWESMIFGGLMMFVFWGGLILIGAWLLQGVRGSRPHQTPENEEVRQPSYRALDILKERYARGVISRAEFEQMREDLST